MNIGLIGLGKLGLPVSVALAQKHTVYGYDKNPDCMKKRTYEQREVGLAGPNTFQQEFNDASIKYVGIPELAENCKLIFVAVQTPHEPAYEGITRIPDERADFDYSHLVNAIKSLVRHTYSPTTIVVISTVLPGTVRREIAPIIPSWCSLVYNPFFIAMGTVVRDFMNPEFVLLGGDRPDAVEQVADFYRDFYGKTVPPIQKMSIESAELTKVAYNTMIGLKISYANALMEISHKLPGCDVDDVIGTIKLAKDRLISTKYLTPGMCDGGGCHPRDAIAMSWLARKLKLSHDIFSDLMETREDQTEWLADLMVETGLPLVILGKAFKPETNITTGSPAILCANILEERKLSFQIWDPFVDGGDPPEYGPSVFLIGTKHAQFIEFPFARGSVVLDPHRYIPHIPGVNVIPIGKN